MKENIKNPEPKFTQFKFTKNDNFPFKKIEYNFEGEDSNMCDLLGRAEKEDSEADNDQAFLIDSFEGDIRSDSCLKLLVLDIEKTYNKICPSFVYEKKYNYVLTEPNKPVKNDGKDNELDNLIVRMNDEIKNSNTDIVYRIIDYLGEGLSGQIFKVLNLKDNNSYAMKIIKNKKAYLTQALKEKEIVQKLNNEIDKDDVFHIIRIKDSFRYCNHLVLVFELLTENLLQLLHPQNGISLSSIRFIIKDILTAIEKVHQNNIIHSDLKPENVLLKLVKESDINSVNVSMDNNINNINNNNNISNTEHKKKTRNKLIIKVTDFGSAIFKGNEYVKYIQSLYYRAPEVIIGMKYDEKIDIWSIGCIAAELYLGNVLLPGKCEYDQLRMITSFIGEIPDYMLLNGRKLEKYYNIDEKGLNLNIHLKDEQTYYKEYPGDNNDKQYKIPYGMKCLDGLINIKKDNIKSMNESGNLKQSHTNSFSLNSSNSQEDIYAFINFLKGLLTIDPEKRWNAKECLNHPFITKKKYDQCVSFRPDDVSQFIYNSNLSSGSFSQYYNQNYGPHMNNRLNETCPNNLFMQNNSYSGYINYPNYYQQNFLNNSNSINNNINNNNNNVNSPNIPLYFFKRFPLNPIEKYQQYMYEKQLRQQYGNYYYNNVNNNKIYAKNMLKMNNSFMDMSFERINAPVYNPMFKGNEFNNINTQQSSKSSKSFGTKQIPRPGFLVHQMPSKKSSKKLNVNFSKKSCSNSVIEEEYQGLRAGEGKEEENEWNENCKNIDDDGNIYKGNNYSYYNNNNNNNDKHGNNGKKNKKRMRSQSDYISK